MKRLLSHSFRRLRQALTPPCLVCGAPARRLICPTCLALWLSEYAWTGCTRCGRSACVACDGLATFADVRAFFRLDPATARLLLDAKDRDDPLAQALLTELCRLTLPRTLLGLSHPVSHVVVSPLRLGRLGGAPWHPVIPLGETARLMAPCVLAPHVRGVRRQTTLSATERARSLQNGELVLSFWDKKSLAVEPEGVLFVDDVLTTGGVAERTRRLFPEKFQCVPWSIATLFRTPVGSLTVKG